MVNAASPPALPSEDAFIAAPTLDLPGFRHAFFTRRGGGSSGIYESLNMGIGSDDDRASVERNRTLAAAVLGVPASRLTTPYQVHSADVVTTDAPFGDPKPKADAVVTATPGLAIGIVTADCGPVLFADPEAKVIGAAHAGWKGAVSGVLDATLAAMESLGASRRRVRACLGPTITAPSYEVGLDMMNAAIQADPEAEPFFREGKGADKRQFDLPEYILSRLSRLQVGADFVGACTYVGADRFFSYRRAQHRGEKDYGRQLSAIAIVGEI